MDSDENGIAYILRRNKELGQVLKRAREIAGVLQRDCANMIGTYRQRYAAIERGEEGVDASELEVLVRYLSIPGYMVWPREQDDGGRAERLVYVQHQEGEVVHIMVGREAAEDIPAARVRDLTEEGKQYERFLWKRPLPPDSQP